MKLQSVLNLFKEYGETETKGGFIHLTIGEVTFSVIKDDPFAIYAETIKSGKRIELGYTTSLQEAKSWMLEEQAKAA
ncbi:MAG: hypothetical protein LUC34_02220 [Campylobacter sp.]|nr:hypothetical protein [Campylobacter sp.]